jgi:predicted nucleotidyltransferase
LSAFAWSAAVDDFWERNLILRVVAGSTAHGLATSTSDLDTRGVCIPPPRYLLGLSAFEQHESDGGDHVVYALAKFVRLALAGNPNIIETLYVAPDHVLHMTDAGRALLAARDLFVTRQVGERFARYGIDQLQRIERHHRWLSDPPKRKPTPEQWDATISANGHAVFPSGDAERAYRAALKHWQHYERWRADRNPQRAALEERYGYDTKHAMHLCRLLSMGREILVEGVVRVQRPDAAWLHSIRDGAWSYEELWAWAREQLDALPTWVASSPLPDTADTDAAEALVIRLQRAFLVST